MNVISIVNYHYQNKEWMIMRSFFREKVANGLFILLLMLVMAVGTRFTVRSEELTAQILPEGIIAVEKIAECFGGWLCKALFQDRHTGDIILYPDNCYEKYNPSKYATLSVKGPISLKSRQKIEVASSQEMVAAAVWLAPIDEAKIVKEMKDQLKFDNLETETAARIEQYITEKRRRFKEAYTAQSEEFIANNLHRENVIFVSKYAPLILVNLAQKEIEGINEINGVQDLKLFVNTVKEEETAYSIPNINAHYTRGTLNLKGSGVKVGIMESGYPDKTNPQLSGRIITFDISDSEAASRLSSHATIVTSIIGGNTEGIAPNTSIYVAGALSRLEDYQKIEWLLDQGVVVINYSAGYSDCRGTYSDMAKWVDHLESQHDVLFVKSAGNIGFSTLISDPGMAYNAIVVGSMYDHDSQSEPYWNDDTLSTFSCYGETTGGYKPDLTAPGQGISIAGYTNSNGTSFAAPHVTGILAQILGYRYNLAVEHSTLKALCLAGTTHKTSVDYGEYLMSPGYSNKEGAGVIDAKGIFTCVSGDAYTHLQLTQSQFPYQRSLNVSTTARPVRVSLTWMKQYTLSAVSNPDAKITERLLSDLDLEVYDPSGNMVGSSISAANNVELVEFNPTVTGTYQIRVVSYAMQNDSEWISLAWYQ
jgi:serine protease AprX